MKRKLTLLERTKRFMDDNGMVPVPLFLKALNVKTSKGVDVVPYEYRLVAGGTHIVGSSTLNLAAWEKAMGVRKELRHFQEVEE